MLKVKKTNNTKITNEESNERERGTHETSTQQYALEEILDDIARTDLREGSQAVCSRVECLCKGGGGGTGGRVLLGRQCWC